MDDSLTVAAAAATAVPLTIACWAWPTNTTLAQALVYVHDGSNTNRFALVARGDVAGDPLDALTNSGGGSAAGRTTTGYSPSVWSHFCGVFASATDRRAFINGGSKGTNATSLTPTGINAMSVGLNAIGGAPFSGRIAEAAVWSATLSDAEVAILATGVSPFNVQGASLVGYWPISGFQSPEEDFDGSNDLTVTGAVAALHPPVEASPVTPKQLAATGA